MADGLRKKNEDEDDTAGAPDNQNGKKNSHVMFIAAFSNFGMG